MNAACRCKGFLYGGCKGTVNNFETVQGCVAACVSAVRPPSVAESKPLTKDNPQGLSEAPLAASAQPAVVSSSAPAAQWQWPLPLFLGACLLQGWQ